MIYVYYIYDLRVSVSLNWRDFLPILARSNRGYTANSSKDNENTAQQIVEPY